jgi:hypothetical protein
VDDLEVWSDEELNYLKEFAHIDRGMVKDRNKVIRGCLDALKTNKKFWKQIGKYIDDVERVSHWFSIVKTRNHGLDRG